MRLHVRQHDDLADVVAAGEAGDGLGDVVGRDRQPLEHGERAVRWFTPMTTIDMAIQPRRSRPRRTSPGTACSGAAAAAGAALLVVAEDLQLDGEVDLAHADAVAGTVSTTGAKLRMLVTPAATSRSAASWAAAAGRGDDADRHVPRAARSAAARRGGGPRTPPITVPTLAGVDVDDAGDREAALAEPAVAGERLAEVAGADDDDRPVVGRPSSRRIW